MPPVGPYAQDVVTSIVNVQWGGGAVVLFANKLSNQLTYYSSKKAGEFKPLGFLEFTKDGTVRGCSYAKLLSGPKPEPIFLLCGDDGGNISGVVHGIIMVSNDGLHWSTTATQSGVRFQRMTWNPDTKAFFAEAQSWTSSDHTTITCWTSTDGRSWEVGGDSFESHLKYGKGACDGQYGFDPSQNDIENAPPTGTTTPDGHLVLWSDIEPPTGNISFAGGVWFHTGGDIETDLYQSTDDTETWEHIGNFGDKASEAIFPLIAGSWQDVQDWEAT
jgi:hypothetical protein